MTPSCDPALLSNTIRASTGRLRALKRELKAASGLELEAGAGLDEPAAAIIRVLLPGWMPGTG